MIIQFNTSNNIEGSERQSDYFSTIISEGLNRFDSQITRVEVYLSDQDNSKNGKEDIRCSLEVRLKSLNPIAVTSNGNTNEEAIKGAIDKMKNSLDTVLGRLSNY
jgi:hypothetical protein